MYHGVVEKVAGNNISWCAFATVKGKRKQAIAATEVEAK